MNKHFFGRLEDQARGGIAPSVWAGYTYRRLQRGSSPAGQRAFGW